MDNFEAVGVKANAPNCQFVRGILLGSYSLLAGRPISCQEVECIAMGAPACKFVLG